MDLNDQIVTDENASTFHSNGFATVANGNRVGSVSTETFEQRKQREQHRQIINGYQASNIGRPFAAAAQSGPASSNISATNAPNQPTPPPVNPVQ